jgi:hypothetical protein
VSVALVVAVVAPSVSVAQSWRTLEVSRQRRDSTPIEVRVTYGSGRFEVRAARPPLLYQMRLTYDADRAEPIHEYDSTTHLVRMGVRKRAVRLGPGSDEERDSRMLVELAPTVPAALALDLGAVDADLDLGGLSLTRVRVESGASEARVRFDAPNAVPMSMLDLQVGAASLRAERLANANARDIRLKAGVGSVDLDFGGEWNDDVELTIEVALGRVHVTVPRQVGVRLDLARVLTSFPDAGLLKRGNSFVSPNWDSASHKLTIKAHTSFGKFEIERS